MPCLQGLARGALRAELRQGHSIGPDPDPTDELPHHLSAPLFPLLLLLLLLLA
jgi:hypothetical protein